MDSVYVRPPRTIREVYESLPEGTLAQLINNQIVMSPAPTNAHQSILMKIAAQLFNYVEANQLGEVRVAPFDVHLNRKNAFQPDIIFMATNNLTKLKESGLYGAPDLVIEILSPSTWHYDKGDKKDEYERSGVKEYWMIDPADKSTEGFYLLENEFHTIGTFKETITLKLLSLTINF